MWKFFRTLIVSYISIVGAIWGFLEAYTYFNGDQLKWLLGPYWLYIYTLPILLAFVIAYLNSGKGDRPESPSQQGNLTSNQINAEIVGGNVQIERYYSNRYFVTEGTSKNEDDINDMSEADKWIKIPTITKFQILWLDL